MTTGAGSQTDSSGRWGDYTATFVDPSDGCTFYHTNEYYSATSDSAWNTRVGSFAFPACTTPTPVQLTSVVSRAIHGSAGTFDVDLTSGNGIECRMIDANGDYMLVFTFSNTLKTVGSATVTSGTGKAATSNIDSNDAHNCIVNLTGVTNAQHITVSLGNVTDSAGDFSSTVSASMGVLIGDVNASGHVDAGDIGAIQQVNSQTANSTNFRADVDTSGHIDAGDIGLTKSYNSTGLSPPP
jgi:hypothetical protein